MSRAAVLEFFDAPGPFDLPPEQAVAHFRGKGLRSSFAWQDVLHQEHETAFTVAKMLDIDLLKDVQESLDKAIAEGVNFRDWADKLTPLLQARGWWGRKDVVDPLTGQTVVAQLGSPGRLETIFRTNMQSAYSHGAYEQMLEQFEDAPYAMYSAVDDWRTRPEHASWDNLVFRIDSEFGRTHHTPCGWNCRCTWIQLDKADVEALGLKVANPKVKYYKWDNPRTGASVKVPDGVDPGFGGLPTGRNGELSKLLEEKIAALPPESRQAVRKGKPDPTPAPAAEPPPRFKFQAFKPFKNSREAVAFMEANISARVSMPRSATLDGLNDVASATLEACERFNLPHLEYIGDKGGDDRFSRAYKMGRNALGGYAGGVDSFIVTAKGLNRATVKEAFENSVRYSQKDLLAMLGRYANTSETVRQYIEQRLPDGIAWSVVKDVKGLTMHELGHRLHSFNKQELDNLSHDAVMRGWNLLVSRYGTTNKSEYIAEAFALYMTGDKSEHWRIMPRLLAFFERNDELLK